MARATFAWFGNYSRMSYTIPLLTRVRLRVEQWFGIGLYAMTKKEPACNEQATAQEPGTTDKEARFDTRDPVDRVLADRMRHDAKVQKLAVVTKSPRPQPIAD